MLCLVVCRPPFYCQNDDIETVEKIMNRKIKWPDSMDGNAKDLIDRLVQVRHRFDTCCGSSELSWLAFLVAACRLCRLCLLLRLG